MLDGILGRGFAVKCKSLIKTTRARMELVRKRAEAKQRFLKEDLGKLLANGLDINAYGRTEEYIAGMNILSCYDYLDQSCEYILKQLSRMQKLEECPEECKEVVATLMYAAARFSDLPELRDLRDTFQERYERGLEAFVNQKFVEKVSLRPPTAEKKIRVLRDIASEFSLKWDFKGFEKRMATPVAAQVAAQAEVRKADTVKQRDGHWDEKSRACGYEEGNIRRKDEADQHMGRRMDKADHHMGRRSDEVDHHMGRRKDNADHHLGRRRDEVDHQIGTRDEADHHLGRRRDEANHHMARRRDEADHHMARRRDEADHHMGGRKDVNGHREKSLQMEGSSSQGENDALFCGRQSLTENNKHSYPVENSDREIRAEKSRGSSHGKLLDNGHAGDTRHGNGIHNPKKRENVDALYYERAGVASSFGERQGKSENAIPIYEHSDKDNTRKSTKKDQEEGGSARLKSLSDYPLPPPYVKSKDKTGLPPYIKPTEDKQERSKASVYAGLDPDDHFVDPTSIKQSSKVNGSDRSHSETNHHDHDERLAAPARMWSFGREEDLGYQEEEIPLPKPRSLRRKLHKSSSSHEAADAPEDVGIANAGSSSRRRDHSRRGLQVLFNEDYHRRGDEEKMIDKLLLHYSKKPSSYEPGKLRKKVPGQQPSSHRTPDNGGSSMDQSRDVQDKKHEVKPPGRSISLPPEQAAASPEPRKVYERANSFQGDNQARHVHPKLPDYDDLAAKFAALKGR